MALLIIQRERHVTFQMWKAGPQEINLGIKRNDRLAAKRGIGGEKCAATQVANGG